MERVVPSRSMSTAHEDIIRHEVTALLARAPAYATLPDATQAQLAHDMASVVGALADGAPSTPADAGPSAREAELPAMVRSLVEGTFQAIVNGSTEQMQAYAALVKGVAGSLEGGGPRAAVTPESVRERIAAVMGHDPRIHPIGWPPKR